jgi:hypothetical protein
MKQHITADELLGALKRYDDDEINVMYGSVPGVRDIIVAYVERIAEPITSELRLDEMESLLVGAELAMALETGIKLGLMITASRLQIGLRVHADKENEKLDSIH